MIGFLLYRHITSEQPAGRSSHGICCWFLFMIIMMFWFYLIAYILVIGIVINITSYEMSTLAKESEKDGVRSKILLRK